MVCRGKLSGLEHGACILVKRTCSGWRSGNPEASRSRFLVNLSLLWNPLTRGPLYALAAVSLSHTIDAQALTPTATIPDWARRTFLIGRKKDGLHELHDSTLVGLTFLPPIAHPGLTT
ncbi:hypothetical protein PCH_Pc20g05160 [Penicillium rubens Wisconsin 54-1255]|uniref:Uncharacterized protein n=1 Tax=Penicillium rubens (strain ATCC 28089 / DSM 1075 / NRRL 1951 / Wisconsin 54-1255) TaxID=500485 RepID=B6HEF6_PENRW|nr:hypothetical protein PCH_Pc20g05160 [Penicillium rubens Wisconsin 54-1255]